MSEKAKDWVSKLKGWFQGNEEPDAKLAESMSGAKDDRALAPTAAPSTSTPANRLSGKTSPSKATHPSGNAPRTKRSMAGDFREQTDWALRQIAFVGQEVLRFAQARNLPNARQKDLDHDMALLKLGYTLVMLSFRANQDEPAPEVLRHLRASMKGALLAVLRKNYHRHSHSGVPGAPSAPAAASPSSPASTAGIRTATPAEASTSVADATAIPPHDNVNDNDNVGGNDNHGDQPRDEDSVSESPAATTGEAVQLGASMVKSVDQELARLESDIAAALNGARTGDLPPLAFAVKYLIPAFGSEQEELAAKVTGPLADLYSKVGKSIKYE